MMIDAPFLGGMMAQTDSFWRGWWIHPLFLGVVAALVGLFSYALLTWPIEASAAHLAHSPDGSKLLAATKYGDVQIWWPAPQNLIQVI